MKIKICVQILLLWIFTISFATTTWAENEPVTGYYDEQNGWLYFEWFDPDYGKQTSIYEPANKVKPTIKTSIEYEVNGENFNYNYEVTNGKNSLQAMKRIVVKHHEPIFDVKTPSPVEDWYATRYFQRDDAWVWSNIGGELTLGLQPGQTARGLSFKSKGLPDIVKCSFAGYSKRFSGPGDSDTIEIDASFEKIFVKLKEQYKEKLKNSVIKKTVGPGKLPEKFNATDFIDHLIDLKHQAQDLGWIKEEGGDGIIQALDQKLDNAKAAIARGNTRSASKILKAFIKQVEAQSC
ncbi:MAG: hypothetical protein KAT46_00465, partial [Deltaproteobacteria bacterium]|nr:hypothetical protein [Deltaproteobacteria bacterium]